MFFSYELIYTLRRLFNSEIYSIKSIQPIYNITIHTFRKTQFDSNLRFIHYFKLNFILPLQSFHYIALKGYFHAGTITTNFLPYYRIIYQDTNVCSHRTAVYRFVSDLYVILFFINDQPITIIWYLNILIKKKSVAIFANISNMNM